MKKATSLSPKRKQKKLNAGDLSWELIKHLGIKGKVTGFSENSYFTKNQWRFTPQSNLAWVPFRRSLKTTAAKLALYGIEKTAFITIDIDAHSLPHEVISLDEFINSKSRRKWQRDRIAKACAPVVQRLFKLYPWRWHVESTQRGLHVTAIFNMRMPVDMIQNAGRAILDSLRGIAEERGVDLECFPTSDGRTCSLPLTGSRLVSNRNLKTVFHHFRVDDLITLIDSQTNNANDLIELAVQQAGMVDLSSIDSVREYELEDSEAPSLPLRTHRTRSSLPSSAASSRSISTEDRSSVAPKKRKRSEVRNSSRSSTSAASLSIDGSASLSISHDRSSDLTLNGSSSHSLTEDRSSVTQVATKKRKRSEVNAKHLKAPNPPDPVSSGNRLFPCFIDPMVLENDNSLDLEDEEIEVTEDRSSVEEGAQLYGADFGQKIEDILTFGMQRGDSWNCVRKLSAASVYLGISEKNSLKFFREFLKRDDHTALHCQTRQGRQALMASYKSCLKRQWRGVDHGFVIAGGMLSNTLKNRFYEIGQCEPIKTPFMKRFEEKEAKRLQKLKDASRRAGELRSLKAQAKKAAGASNPP